MERSFPVGTIVKHFKREFLSEEEKEQGVYIYRILAEAQHTETNEKLVVYGALYGEGKICARPRDLFYSEVDHEKYPQSSQKYRFEEFNDD